MSKIFLSAVAVAALIGASAARAQDPVKVDPKHYTVFLDNNEVRFLDIHYGPGEKSVMHSRPDSVVVFMTDAKMTMTGPDGKSEERAGQKGEVLFMKAGKHLPENVGPGSMDVMQVELKK